MKIKFGLKQKLIVYFLLVGIVPIATSGIIVNIMNKQEFNKVWKEELNGIAELKAQRIEQYLGQCKDDIKLLAKAPGLETNTASNDISGINQQLTDNLADLEKYDAMMILSKNGSLITYQASTIKSVEYTGAWELRQDLSQKPYYSLIYANRENTSYNALTDFHMIEATGNVAIEVAAPIYNNSIFVGVYVGVISMDALNDVMQ
ncbi:MAG: cache domain-containing protein, partial [Promethearchaeota archaeon]